MVAGVLTGTAMLAAAAVLGGGELSGILLSPADLPAGDPVRPVTMAATDGAPRSPSSGRAETVPPAHRTPSADPPGAEPTPDAGPSRTRTPQPEPERTRGALPATPPEEAASGGPAEPQGSTRPPGTVRPSGSTPARATSQAPKPTKDDSSSSRTKPGRTAKPVKGEDGSGAAETAGAGRPGTPQDVQRDKG